MECPQVCGDMKPIEYGTDIRVRRCSGCGVTAIASAGTDASRVAGRCRAGYGECGSGRQEQRNTGYCLSRLRCTMRRIADEEQSHVTLVCPACDGVFPGCRRIGDLKSVTLMDHLRRLLAIFESNFFRGSARLQTRGAPDRQNSAGYWQGPALQPVPEIVGLEQAFPAQQPVEKAQPCPRNTAHR